MRIKNWRPPSIGGAMSSSLSATPKSKRSDPLSEARSLITSSRVCRSCDFVGYSAPIFSERAADWIGSGLRPLIRILRRPDSSYTKTVAEMAHVMRIRGRAVHDMARVVSASAERQSRKIVAISDRRSRKSAIRTSRRNRARKEPKKERPFKLFRQTRTYQAQTVIVGTLAEWNASKLLSIKATKETEPSMKLA